MIFSFGGFRLDTRLLELRRDDIAMHMEPRAFDVLRLLIENRDRVVSKDELLDRVWDGRIVSESTLGSSINAVRRAVGDDGKRQAIIRTLPRRGFRFVQPVVVISEAPSPALEDDARTVSYRPDKPAIAVLPFRNNSGDPDQEYFADGLTDDITTDISIISGLFVIARNSTFAYKGRTVDLQQVSRDLGVRYIMEGSVRKAGDRVRVSAQLIDGATGGHVWAERYDRELADIFVVQDELTTEIVSKLALGLTEDERKRLGRRGTTSIEAYDYFIRGRARTWLFTKENGAEAHDLLHRAIELDPMFASPYAFLAFNHVLDYSNRWTESFERSLETGVEMAMKAVGLDETEPYGHWALGLASSYGGDQERAIGEAKRCLALEPSSPEGHYLLSHSLIYAGRFQEAIDTLNEYFRLDPTFPDFTLHFMAEGHYHLKKYEEAIAYSKQRLDRNPASEATRVLLSACYGQVGRLEEARAEWSEAHRINPSYSFEHKRHVLPFADARFMEHVADGLRKAGLPVK